MHSWCPIVSRFISEGATNVSESDRDSVAGLLVKALTLPSQMASSRGRWEGMGAAYDRMASRSAAVFGPSSSVCPELACIDSEMEVEDCKG